MSRTLSTNSGSLESLKVSERCGCTLKAAHIRRTVVCDSPLSRAIERSDQWVASAGVVSSVRSMTAATFTSVSVRGRPGRGSSDSPSMRSFRKRRRHIADRVLVHAEFDCHRLVREAVCAAQDHAAAIGQRARDPAASSLTFKIRPFFIALEQNKYSAVRPPSAGQCHVPSERPPKSNPDGYCIMLSTSIQVNSQKSHKLNL